MWAKWQVACLLGVLILRVWNFEETRIVVSGRYGHLPLWQWSQPAHRPMSGDPMLVNAAAKGHGASRNRIRNLVLAEGRNCRLWALTPGAESVEAVWRSPGTGQAGVGGEAGRGQAGRWNAWNARLPGPQGRALVTP